MIRRKTEKIRIGEISRDYQQEMFNTKEARINWRYWNNLVCCGSPGFGKSSLIKDIVVKLYQLGHNILIFDAFSRWYQDITVSNYRSENPYHINPSDIFVLKNPGIMLSDMKDPKDWWYLFKIEGRGAEILHRVNTRLRDYHLNDPYLFMQIIEKLPSKQNKFDNELTKWNNSEYGRYVYFPKQIHPTTVTAIQNNYRPEIFFNPNDEKEWRTYIEDLAPLFDKYQVVLVDCNLQSPSHMNYMGFVVGNFLQKLKRSLGRIQPDMIFEEGDQLFNNQVYYKSTDLGETYVTKFRSIGSSMILITQNISMLNSRMYKNRTHLISFHQDIYEGHGYSKRLGTLQYNLDYGKREALMDDVISGQFFYFNPDISCCKV